MVEGKVPMSIRRAASRAIENKRPAFEKWLPADGSTPPFRPMEEREADYPDNTTRWINHGHLILGEGGHRYPQAIKAALMGLMAVCDDEGYSFADLLKQADETLTEHAKQDQHRRDRGFRGIMLDELAARSVERASLRREAEARKKKRA
jgi:hypothetical protein